MIENIRNRTLTTRDKERIWQIINRNMNPDDKDPWEVIEESYAGDEEGYLKDMALWHHVPLGEGVYFEEL